MSPDSVVVVRALLWLCMGAASVYGAHLLLGRGGVLLAIAVWLYIGLRA